MSVQTSDLTASEVKRVNQQLEERHYEFRSNCNDDYNDASACHSWGEWLAVVNKNYKDAVAGKGLKQSDSDALKLFEKSCAGGHAAGCHHVGFMRLQGIGCQNDFVKALAAFKEGCKHDDAHSCNRVASMYLSPAPSSPIERDVQEAKTYLEKACDANFAPACHNLAVMYKKGDGSIPKNQSKYEEYRTKTQKLVEHAGGISSIKST